MVKIIITTLLFFNFLVQISFSQEAHKNLSNRKTQQKTYNTKRVKSAPTIDGLHNDKVWDIVKWAGDFVQSEPNEGETPLFQTKFKIIYDSNFIYIAIRCYDNEPEKIAVPVTPRDNFKGDWMDVNINSDFDKNTACSFTIKASGVRADEFIRNDGWNWDAGWNPNWKGKTKIDSIGWTAEMRIPMNQLNIVTSKEQIWGIQLTRKISRNNERSTWKLIPYETDKWVSLFAELHGIEGVVVTPTKSFIPEYKYSIRELKEDFNVLRDALEGVFPSLYSYTNKETMDYIFGRIYDSIDKPMTLPEFYTHVFPVYNKMGDGHSRLYLTRDYLDYSKKNIKKIPFSFKIQGNNIYIIENYSNDTTIVKGTQIISIDGKPINQIINKLSGLLTADGYNQTFKHKHLSGKFNFYYSLYDNTGNDIFFEFLYPNKKTTQLKIIKRLYEREIQENKTRIYNEPIRKKNFEFEVIDNSIAVITIRTFLNDEALKKFIDDSFNNIDSLKLENLIIDLRDNRGGNDYNGAYLYSYLTDKPFEYYDRFETRLAPKQKAIPSIEHFNSFENLIYLTSIISADSIGRNVISDFESTYHKNPKKLHKPEPNNYKGNVYILIDGGSFSVTSEFCSIVHKNQRALFIGEETGGGYYGNTSGLSCDLILPNTKIIAHLPLIKFVSAVTDSHADYGRGIIPDIAIHPSVYDIINAIDTEMDFALKMIQMNK